MSTLRGLDCQYGQGYYFARPLTADALGDLLHRQAGEPGWNLARRRRPALAAAERRFVWIGAASADNPAADPPWPTTRRSP